MSRFRSVLQVWILANILLGISFTFHEFFWLLFPLSLTLLLLISLKFSNRGHTERLSPLKSIFLGALSGSLLYLIFLMAYLLIGQFDLPFLSQVKSLYAIVGPSNLWQYVLLVIIIIPGEEFFWRGYIQPAILKWKSGLVGVLISACFYAFAHLWSGNLMLVAAAFTAGIAWGALYEWKRSLLLVIISHLVFDILLLVVMPLNF
ncbi:CPBP family intramembrane metalloprotease [Bacillus tianshenii]|uniref:CPBP family intramembrane glutamic endopeptidase n=1 Tax=Sutcliffiella tianshenii TaxID=1463404 RepID=UPI001CD22068|nr:type II CAAX endopeptidase family protein [Bacillus tianshenii]MCA1319243.1 CPBP family intramembrane metalloprotease [Bacillus tianshenii]